MSNNTELHLWINNTPSEIYDAFVRTFGQEGESLTKWCTFYTQDDTRVTLFAPRVTEPHTEDDEA